MIYYDDEGALLSREGPGHQFQIWRDGGWHPYSSPTNIFETAIPVSEEVAEWMQLRIAGPPDDPLAKSDWIKRSSAVMDRLKSGPDCGANAPGGGGFQPGNTCAEGAEPGSGSGGSSSGRSAPTAEEIARDQKRFDEIKREWAIINDRLLYEIEDPSSPEAQEMVRQQSELIKSMHRLQADPGGLEGVGKPGGPRDVLIVGAGPAGLSAAVNGGTEGLDTLVVEMSDTVGGQAKFSSRIENLPGFPIGASGKQLAERMKTQAERVGAQIQTGVKVIGMSYDEETGLKTVKLSTGEEVQSRSVIIAGGLQFRELKFPGSDSPKVVVGDAEKVMNLCAGGRTAVVIGGSNGAAQAALGIARKAKTVHVLSRSPVKRSMSDYQVSALSNHPKINVIEGDVVDEFLSDDNTLVTKGGNRLDADYVGVFVGSAPDMAWMPEQVERSNRRVGVDGNFQTTMPGVYAVGDIRDGGAGRVGAALGEGQLAIKNVFRYFPTLGYDKSKEVSKSASEGEGRESLPKATDFAADWDETVDLAIDVDLENPFHSLRQYEERSALDQALRSQFAARVEGLQKASDCGANAPGGGGFQPGNTCAADGGGGGGRSASGGGKVSALMERLKKSGGFTHHPSGRSPKSGYMVSLHPEHEEVHDISDVTPKTLADYMRKHREIFASDPKLHFGGWYNNEGPDADHKVYLDISTVFDDQQQAEQVGREHNQLGGYDLATGKTFEIMTQAERRAAEVSKSDAGSGSVRGTVVAVPQDDAEIAEAAIEMYEALTGMRLSDVEKDQFRKNESGRS